MEEEIRHANLLIKKDIEDLVNKHQHLIGQYDKDFRSSSSSAKDLHEKESANEPEHYCFCGQNYQIDLIGCENDDCPVGWFHLSCVGLTEVPNGEWYCDSCTKKSSK